SVSQDVRGNAFRRGRKIFKPGAAKKQIANDEQGPAVAKNVQRIRYRTRGTLRRRTFFADLISTANRHDCRMPHYLLAIHKYFTCILQVLLNTAPEMTVNYR